MHPATTPVLPTGTLQASPPATSPSGTPDLQFAQLSPGPLQAPSAQDHAEFIRAAGGATLPEVQAEAPSQEGGIGSRLMQQMEQLTRRLGGLQGGTAPQGVQAGSPAPAAPAPAGQDPSAPQAAGFDRAGMNDAVAQIERAYMFAIETTMVSRGSTESTKIFNTLLKGQ